MGEKVIHVGESDFESAVLSSEVPVLVDFWASWCGPCRMIAPLLEQLAAEFDGRLKIVKLNTDEHPALAGRFGIRGIPTLKIFKAGKEADTLVGAGPLGHLRGFIEKNL